MIETGSVINGLYEVREPIGEGGAGQVYLAWHKNLRKKVVIKRIKDKFVGKVNERREADILKNLHHRYIPQVYDFVQMGTEIYTVIDYVDGNTLMEYIIKKKRFDEYQIVKWLRQLCEALDYLHSQNPPIIHSDIKPSNIMVDLNGDICLIDYNISFGEDNIEKISGYTAGYASPEQILKARIYSTGGNYSEIKLDVKSDIYSLGASIYHIMTLKNPLKVIAEEEELWDTSISLPYSELLKGIIEKSLKWNPKERYQTAGEMLLDLESMKVRDKRYKQLNLAQTVYTVAFSLLITVGILLLIKGSSVINEEEFEQEYDRVIYEAGRDEYETAINHAIYLLNNGKYVEILTKRKREKADLLYSIANSYFENEDYENAISFYTLTLDEDISNPEYFRDYAIALARTGESDNAEKLLNKGISTGLNDEDLYLVKAEIALAKGEWDEAIQYFDKTINMSEKNNTTGRAYLLCARAYRSKGDVYRAIDLMDEAGNLVDDVWRIRITSEEGSACIQCLEQDPDNREILEKADICYKALTNSERSTLNDWLNYSLITKMKRDNDGAIRILEEARKHYSDEYRLPMRQALYEIDSQSGLNEENRDYKTAEKYYEEAKELYNKEINSGNSDEEMQNLEELMRRICDHGFLD